MAREQLALITDVIGRAPEWVRYELTAKDPSNRQRAEEALAAMIAAALHRDIDTGQEVGSHPTS